MVDERPMGIRCRIHSACLNPHAAWSIGLVSMKKMRRSAPWAVLGAAALVAASMSTPAVDAQDEVCLPPPDPDAPTTTATTLVPPTTVPGSTTTLPPCPAPTLPPTTTALPPVTAPPAPPPPGDPLPPPASPNQPAPPTTVAPTTTAPVEEPPIERVGYYANQPEFTRRTTPIAGSLADARRRRNEAAVVVENARQDVTRLEAGLAVEEQQLGALAAAEKAKADDLLAATRDFETRVVDAYVRGRPVPLAVLQGSEAIADVVSKIVMLEQVLEKDHEAVAQYEGLREEVGAVVAAAVARLDDLEGELQIARDWLRFSEVTLAEAEFEIEVWAGNSDTFVPGFVFPVASGYSFIDSWGFPRGPGTPWEHWHEGADIFAPTGTELLAAETGVISRLADGGRGGLALYIEGRSGSKHYYAHLNRYAEGIAEGRPVTAGEVVGYVGDSGNAAGGLPHLHYEIHPGDRPVNPYPLLAASSRRQTARLASLTEPSSPLASAAGSGD